MRKESLKRKSALLAGLLAAAVIVTHAPQALSSESASAGILAQAASAAENAAYQANTAASALLDEIPAYDGDPYVAVYDNVPTFTQAELTDLSFESYSELDTLGRAGAAFASVGVDLMPTQERESISSVYPSGWVQAGYDFVDGGYLWNRCHLIGYQLTAENANEKNLITGTRYLNVEGMLPFENMIADFVEETEYHVLYRVTPIYDGDDLVASGVLMEAQSVEDGGEGISFCVYCYNVQPGIAIDYATGDSELEEDAAAELDAQESTTSSASLSGLGSSGSTAGSASAADEASETTVWIPTNGGTRYHSSSSCSSMKNPTQTTQSAAEAAGYTACRKCW